MPEPVTDPKDTKTEGLAPKIKGLVDRFTGFQEEMKGLLAKQDGEIKKHGETSAETAKSIQAVETRMTEVGEELKSSQERIEELEKKAGRPNLGSGPESKSLGEIFVEDESTQGWAPGQSKASPTVEVKGGFAPFLRRAAMAKSVLTSGAAGGEIIPAQMLADILSPIERVLTVRDLFPVLQTQSNAIEYIREVGFYVEGGEAAVATAAVANGVATITTSAAHGYRDFQKVRIAGVTDETDLNGDHRIEVTGATTFTFPTTAGDTAGAAGTITALALDTHGAGAPTAEGTDSPEAAIEFSHETAPVRTVSHWLPATRQLIQDRPGLQGYIDQRLIFGLLFEEEAQLIAGDGTGENLTGVLTDADIQQYSWSAGASGDTKIDALRRAMTRSMVADYPVTGAIVNPQDWEDVELAKGSDGHYLFIQSVNEGGQQRFFRVPVVVTNAIPAGTSLVGAFGLAATIWDRQQAQMFLSTEHADFFVKRQIAMLAEERLSLTIYRPESFVEVTFDAAP